MSPTPARILAQRDCTAMAALDTMPHLAQRVRNLLSHGRRITVTRRYTYVNDPPEVTAGLTIDTDAYNGGIDEGIRPDGHHFGVLLRPGLTAGFGFSAYAFDGNAVEAEVWKRYHAGKDATDVWAKRRNMTLIDITGGLPGDGPARDDRIVIREWNDSAVCDERVIVFDAGPSEGEYRAARWLYGNALGSAHVGDRLEAWDRGRVSDADTEMWAGRAAELMVEVAAEPR